MIRDKGLLALLVSSLLAYAVMQYMGIGVIPLRSIIVGDGSIPVAGGEVRADVVMAMEGSDLYIAWYDPVSDAVMLRASYDGGSTFSNPILVSSTEGLDGVRVRGMIAKGSHVNVLWSGVVNGQQYDIFLSHSSDNALTFSTTNLSSNDGDSEYPVIDASGPAVYVAWVDLTYGRSEVLLRISNDGGSTFDDAINISNSEGDSEAPVLVAEGSNVYIAWHDNSRGRFAVMFRASHDNGRTFSEPVILSDVDTDAGFASMDADGSSVYIAWMSSYASDDNMDHDNSNGNDDGNSNSNSSSSSGDGFNIHMRYSNDGGKSFSEPISIGKGRSPVVKSDGPLVCIAWMADGGAMFTSMYAGRIRDDTVTITADGYDTATSTRSIILDVEGGDVSILMLLGRGSEERIVYAGSRGSSSFLTTIIVEGAVIDDMSMLSKGRGIHIAWSEKLCTDPYCSHIRFSYHFGKSTDGGYSFIKKDIQ